MKITQRHNKKKKDIILEEIHSGTIFMFATGDSDYYMKTTEKDNDGLITIVNIKDGSLTAEVGDEEVVCIDAELVVE